VVVIGDTCVRGADVRGDVKVVTADDKDVTRSDVA
jgi:hypothetical protein